MELKMNDLSPEMNNLILSFLNIQDLCLSKQVSTVFKGINFEKETQGSFFFKIMLISGT
jgi:hypothetical protein